MANTATTTTVQQSSFDIKSLTKIARFAKRQIKNVFIMSCTIFFPIAMAALLISELHYSYNHVTSISMKIKNSVKKMMFAMPVLGTIFIRKFFTSQFCDGLYLCGVLVASKRAIQCQNFIVTCIPFFSSFMVSKSIADYIFVTIYEANATPMVQQYSVDTKNFRKIAYFAKQIAYFAKKLAKFSVIVTGIVLFPLTMLAVGAVNLHSFYNDAGKRSFKIKNGLKSMMYPLPLIGPLLIREFCDEMVIGKAWKFSKNEMQLDGVSLLTCIPFVSTFLAAKEVAKYLFDKPLNSRNQLSQLLDENFGLLKFFVHILNP